MVFNDYPVENYHSLIRRQTSETDTHEQLSRTAHVINHLRNDNVFLNTFVTARKYPYCKEDLIGLTNKTSIFLLELFTKVKYNTGKSKWTKINQHGKNKLSCHLATLNIDVDERHLPMAFSSDYPPIDPLERCHLYNSCQVLQSISTSSTSHITILLSCSHIYHQYCLQYIENKCLHCLKYITDEINNNVKSIICRITEKNSKVEIDQENEVQFAENDKPEELLKQPLFNSQTENQFKIALDKFMKN